MIREYSKEHYLKLFRKALRNRKLSLKELSEKLKLNRSTVQRWADVFCAMGLLKEERLGRERLLYFENKK